MSLIDDVATLKADLAELEKFYDQAESERVIKMLSADVEKLKAELAAEEKEIEKKKKVEEEKKAEEEKKQKQKESDERKAKEAAEVKKAETKAKFGGDSAGEFVTKGGMVVSADANQMMTKIKSGLKRDAPNTACILKIAGDGKTLEFDQWLDDVDVEGITEELEDIDPRYIFYSYNKVMPDGRLKTPLVFIYYSPKSAPPKKLMETTRWKNEVSKQFEVVKTIEVRDLEDFTQEWFDSVS